MIIDMIEVAKQLNFTENKTNKGVEIKIGLYFGN